MTLLGATLAMGTCDRGYSQDIYTPQQRKEQETISGVAGFLGALVRSGAIPARTENDARAMAGLSAGLSAISQSQNSALMNESIRYSGAASGPQINVYPVQPSYPIPSSQPAVQAQPLPAPNHNKVSPELESILQDIRDNHLKPGIFICNYYKDFNGDNYIQKNEFVGVERNNFKSNEAITLGVYIPGVIPHSGLNLGIKVYSPKGELALSGKSEFRLENKHEYRWFNLSAKELIAKSGAGNYCAVFSLNDVYMGKQEFSVANN